MKKLTKFLQNKSFKFILWKICLKSSLALVTERIVEVNAREYLFSHIFTYLTLSRYSRAIVNMSDINFHNSQSERKIPYFLLNVQTILDSIQEIFLDMHTR